MNILRQLLPIPLIVFVLLTVQKCTAQTLPESPIVAANNNSLVPVKAQKEIRICENTDELSNTFCKCKDRVVSCDFSQYTGLTVNNTVAGRPNILELDLYGFKFPSNTSRFCICNTPPTLHLNFSKDHFLPLNTNRIQRFDLFNLTGVTHFMEGFQTNFQGDLYMANVSKIPEIRGFEFGRGNDDGPFQNVQDYQCCSPIKLNQNHEKPVLFIENSTIDVIRTNGLNDDHIWKTLIFKSVTFNKIEEHGISFLTSTDRGFNFNVAILRSTFKNASSDGMMFQDASNMFLAKNTFTYKNRVNASFFGSRSELNNSNVLLIDNYFWNEQFMRLDARRIIGWYNIFDLWDDFTFRPMNLSSFSQPTNSSKLSSTRSIAFKYNVIRVAKLPQGSIDFGAYTATTMADNVLGSCNCSIFNITDKMVKPELNWCYVGKVSNANGKCSVRLDAAFKECSKSGNVNFEKLCDDKKISIPGFPHVGANLTEDVEKMLIPSVFISRIVEEFHWVFGINRVTKLRKLLTDEDKDKPSKDGSSKKKSVALPVIVTLVVAGLLVVLGIFVYKRQNIMLRMSGRQELVNESRNELT